MIIVNVGPVESDNKAGLEKALPVGVRATDNLGSPADMAADVACTGAVLEVPGYFYIYNFIFKINRTTVYPS